MADPTTGAAGDPRASGGAKAGASVVGGVVSYHPGFKLAIPRDHARFPSTQAPRTHSVP
jgi:hypothetical protein